MRVLILSEFNLELGDKEWRDANLTQEGNMWEFARVEQLIVLANIEAMPAEFIRMGLSQPERLSKLNQIAISQLKSLSAHGRLQQLPLDTTEKQ